VNAGRFTEGRSVKDRLTTKDENESRQACIPGQLEFGQDRAHEDEVGWDESKQERESG